jgi:hypothetical protein
LRRQGTRQGTRQRRRCRGGPRLPG